jgi:hypothetical protein
MQNVFTKHKRLRLHVKYVKIFKEFKLEIFTDRGGDLRNKHLLNFHTLFLIVPI